MRLDRRRALVTLARASLMVLVLPSVVRADDSDGTEGPDGDGPEQTQGEQAPTDLPASDQPDPNVAAGPKVNANTASVAELERAFEAAGIPNAARWALEVEEYRPYPTDDPTFAKLRRSLAKYNPGPGVVDQIISTLML